MHTPLLAQTFHDGAVLSDFVLTQAHRYGLAQTLAALPLARQCHQGQYRKGGDIPYITHPLATACHALSLGLMEDALIAALLLHDVIEDAGMTADQLPVSPAAAKAVQLVSKTPGYIEADYYAAIATNPWPAWSTSLTAVTISPAWPQAFRNGRWPPILRKPTVAFCPFSSPLRTCGPI